jgi:hypothetical protein
MSLIFDWEDAADPENDGIAYSLIIASDSGFHDIVYQEHEISTSSVLVDKDAGLSDMTDYFWKVEAADAYGKTTESVETWSFSTADVNPAVGWFEGHIYSADYWDGIKGAVVTVGSTTIETDADGYFICQVSTNVNNPVEISANGYMPVKDSVYLSAAMPNISKNYKMNPSSCFPNCVKTAISILQILTGIEPSMNIDHIGDVNENGKLGPEDAIGHLQEAAGLR